MGREEIPYGLRTRALQVFNSCDIQRYGRGVYLRNYPSDVAHIVISLINCTTPIPRSRAGRNPRINIDLKPLIIFKYHKRIQ